MFHQFKFGTSEITYILLRDKKAQAVKIAVEFEHGLEVIAPYELAQESIEEILYRKGSWIIEKLKALEAIEAIPVQREFISGEKYAYLGRLYTLVVEERSDRRPFLVLRNKLFEASIKPDMQTWERRELIHELFQKWYKKRATIRLKEQIELHAQYLNLYPTEVKILEMERRWGSCSPQGLIQLNWRLVMAPVHIVDYLVIHELCHLKIPDHSPKFWDFLASIISDYEERREWLRINGPTLRA